jgi:murein DD-endopeptidase MepM/ murein hydrolase activator NlpD/muramidase (phage lysozyme)
VYFIRIKIGKDDEFVIGDGLLQECKVHLDEGQNASNCTFKIYDKSRKYTEKYFKLVYEQNGLTSLPPVEQSGSSSAQNQTPGSAADQNSTTLNTDVNTRAFLDMIAFSEGSQRYNILFGGGSFNSYADHPRRVIQGSSASGRYQILQGTFDDARSAIGVTDFSPQSQDRVAIWLINRDGALDEVRAGNIDAAIDLTNGTWVSFDVKPRAELLAFWRQRVEFYNRGGQTRSQATNSVQSTNADPFQKPALVKAEVGSQITIELGYQGQILTAYSFLHTSLNFDLFNQTVLVFGGQSANWVMAATVKNTAYSNITFKQFAQKICDNYGLRLDFKGDLNPKYEYFPQRGISDYDALLTEARRLGYRVYCQGNTLQIYDRRSKNAGKDAAEFVFEYADNLGLVFNVSHTAQSGTGDGARSSDPNQRSTTGQRKAEINPGSGTIVLKQKDTLVARGKETTSTTGSDVASVKPNVENGSDSGALEAQSNEARIRGVTATIGNVPFRPEYLYITPDVTLSTRGIAPSLDRIWVIQSIDHDYTVTGGFKHQLTLYTPLKAREPAPTTGGDAVPGDLPPNNPNGFIKPCQGVLTSAYRTRRRPNHKGIDIASNAGTPIYASQDGVVNGVVNSCPGLRASDGCGGGYGNRVYLNHSGGFQTRYAHLQNVSVSNGQTVKQGALIGLMGNSGASRGIHLHFEIRLNGEPVNPQQYITV